MKKLLLIFLVLALTLALIACGGENGEAVSPPATPDGDVQPPDEDTSPSQASGQPVLAECSFDEGLMSLLLPGDWEYEIVSTGETGEFTCDQGIVFWPEAEPELRLALGFRGEPVGICGTGVTFTDMEFANGLTATACTEGLGDTFWYLLIYDYQSGIFTVESNSKTGLFAQYEDEITAVLDTVFLTVYR